jgi:hypothetical protein
MSSPDRRYIKFSASPCQIKIHQFHNCRI